MIDPEQVLIVLEQNLEGDTKDNYGTQVLQTFFGGQIAYDRE